MKKWKLGNEKNYLAGKLVSRGIQQENNGSVNFSILKSAYDSVLPGKLFEKLTHLGITIKFANFVHDSCQKMQNLDIEGGERIGPKISNRSLAQGSPLSSLLLFNSYTLPFYELILEDMNGPQYADDFTIYYSGTDMQELTRNLNE